jgi:hypothetical protein
VITLVLGLLGVAALSAVLYGGTMLQTQRTARRARAREDQLGMVEYVTERCAGCDGAQRVAGAVCGRCGGTGRPPTDVDRLRQLARAAQVPRGR